MAGAELFKYPLIPSTRAVGPSHLSGDGKAIELKHQRNPDAFFDCVRSADGAWSVGDGLLAVNAWLWSVGDGLLAVNA